MQPKAGDAPDPGAVALPGAPPCARRFVVYRAKCSYSGAVVVLKGYSRDALTHQTRQRIWSEVNILQVRSGPSGHTPFRCPPQATLQAAGALPSACAQGAQCPFILKCFDSFEDQGWWFLVLENCAAGDLYRIVQSEGRITNEGWLVSQVSHLGAVGGARGHPCTARSRGVRAVPRATCEHDSRTLLLLRLLATAGAPAAHPDPGVPPR